MRQKRRPGVRELVRVSLVWLCVIAFIAFTHVEVWAQAAGQRLILKDGSYQIVTRYEIQGDRVRYQSAERGNEWEEIPYALIDWPATKDWTRAHAAPGAPGSQAEDQAATIDKEAAAERAAEAARQPVVAPGLRLPDESGVWALDSFRSTPELVRVEQSNGNVNRATGHTVLRAAIPAGGAKDMIRLPGYRAAVELHVSDPVFYVSVDTPDNPAPESAMVVNTQGESQADKDVDKREHSDPHSRYAIVRLQVIKNQRVIQAMRLSLLGRPSQASDIIATRADLTPGGHWLKVTPSGPLGFGEYALVELLSSNELNLDCWDFGINPRALENKHAFAPLAPAPDTQ